MAREVGEHWNRFLDYCRRAGLALRGVRVFEFHPGTERRGGEKTSVTQTREHDWDHVVEECHGLHVHFAASEWYPVDVIRAAAKAAGFGRVHVQLLGAEDGARQARYLSKYVSKQMRSKPGQPGGGRLHWLRGMRLWANFGKNPCAVRCKDCEKWTAFKLYFRFKRDLVDPFREFGRVQLWYYLQDQLSRWIHDPFECLRQMPGGNPLSVVMDEGQYWDHYEAGAQGRLFNGAEAGFFPAAPAVPASDESEKPDVFQLYFVL